MEILHEDNVKTEYLLEDSRSLLLQLSKRNPNYADGKFKTRYERRIKSRISNSVAKYNKIDMNKLFKDGILDVEIDVQGETDNYTVKLSFGDFIDNLLKLVENQKGEFDLRAVSRALLNSFNLDDVYIHCSCADWKFRFSYWSTKNNFNSGLKELRPADKTNPNNDKGVGCKHVMLVLSNTTWLLKAASVICNYVNYMKEKKPALYLKFIYPSIYGEEYKEPKQLTFEDELNSDSDTIDTTNKYAKTKNQFKPGNQTGNRFTSNKEDDQLSFDED